MGRWGIKEGTSKLRGAFTRPLQRLVGHSFHVFPYSAGVPTHPSRTTHTPRQPRHATPTLAALHIPVCPSGHCPQTFSSRSQCGCSAWLHTCIRDVYARSNRVQALRFCTSEGLCPAYLASLSCAVEIETRACEEVSERRPQASYCGSESSAYSSFGARGSVYPFLQVRYGFLMSTNTGNEVFECQ